MKKDIKLILDEIIVNIPDFPKKGIQFKDLTPILNNYAIYKRVLVELYKRTKKLNFDCIVSPESRGFWFGIPLAFKAKVPFVPCRKPGKLPRKVLTETYALEYGKNQLCVHEGDIKPNARVLIVDDLVATSGTASAIAKLIKQANANVVGSAFVLGLKEFNPIQEIEKITQAPCIILKEI